VDRLVRRCLAKAPDDRWDSAHDVADELCWLRETSGASTTAGTMPRRRRWQTRALLVTGAATVVMALIAAALWLPRRGSVSQAPVSLLLTEQRPALPANPQRALAISRDGRTVVYAAESGVRHLYLRRLESLQSTIVAGTAGAMAPFFSPGGDRVGFFAEGQLKVVSLGGGAPVTLAGVGDDPRGGTWSRDDAIIFAPDTDSGLWQIPAGGGTATLLSQPDVEKHERSYRWPEILPDDDTILFTLAMSDILSFDEGRLVARSRRTGEQREVLRGSFRHIRRRGTCSSLAPERFLPCPDADGWSSRACSSP
jgi:serine/threonine-protein kinase